MNSLDITNVLRENKFTRRIFMGVFPIDRLPDSKLKLPIFVVINTAVSSHPGEHWIAIYIPKYGKYIEMFDSYGRFFSNNFITKFIQINSKKKIILFNSIQLQGPFSSVCGQYCCVYGYFRSREKTMDKFLRQFSGKFVENDRKISDLFKRYFRNNLKSFSKLESS